MAEDYKFLYEQLKKMLDIYQGEVVPNLRQQLESRVEVVRCKDCKHYKQEYSGDYFRCQVFQGNYEHGFPTEENDYCSYGERRVENDS